MGMIKKWVRNWVLKLEPEPVREGHYYGQALAHKADTSVYKIANGYMVTDLLGETYCRDIVEVTEHLIRRETITKLGAHKGQFGSSLGQNQDSVSSSI
jgi:hypothetical protein